MKKWIFASFVALALVASAVPYAHGKYGRGHGWDLRVRLSGSNNITSTEDGVPTPTTEAGVSLGSGLAKGGGSAVFTALTTFGKALPDDRCPAELPFGANLTSTVVLTSNDGSILELYAGAESFFCSDGVMFVAELQGPVVGGERRFEGAEGTWSGIAEVDGARLTGDLTVELD